MEGKVEELDLHGKSLESLKDLSKLKYLRVLDASCNDISKIEGLSGNKELRELKLYANHIKVLDGLERLTELAHLLLHYNKISSIGKGLRNCHKLCVLRLDHNLLESLSAGELAPCSATLSHLDLSYNQLCTAAGLGSLVNLAELNLEENCLREVPDLERCKKLSELNLSGNRIEVHSLSRLKIPQLKMLKLASISLSSLSPLPKLPQLQDLHAPYNSLTSLGKCPSLFPSLELLNVKENLLATAECLAALQGLGELVELEVEGNPLCSLSSDNGYRTGIHQLLPKIEILDGVSKPGVVDSTNTGVPLMRPLTSSAIGPSLRQVERQLLEAEMQLHDHCSQIATEFELIRAREQEMKTRADWEEPASEKSGTYNRTPAYVSGTYPQDYRTDTQGNKTGAQDSRTISCETSTSKSEIQTRSGSQARLQEALIYASEKNLVNGDRRTENSTG